MKAIITGAASGIGSASATALARGALDRGGQASLLLVDYSEARLIEVSKALNRSGANTVALAGDLRNPEFAQTIAQRAMQEFGGIDTLVSNAGVLMTAPLAELSLEDYERVFEVNTRATWLLAKACYAMLKASRGCVIATASISASQPTPPHGSYSASKAALVMLIRQLANEWGPDGIRCNCISPGMVHTGMTDSVYSDPVARAERASHIPLQRVGLPEDIANVVNFLASSQASYITGVDLAVDGGVQTSLMPTLRQSSVPR